MAIVPEVGNIGDDHRQYQQGSPRRARTLMTCPCWTVAVLEWLKDDRDCDG